MKRCSASLSLFANKVEIALAEKALAFERTLVPFDQRQGYSPKHPDVLAANPKGQVPVLIDGALTRLPPGISAVRPASISATVSSSPRTRV